MRYHFVYRLTVLHSAVMCKLCPLFSWILITNLPIYLIICNKTFCKRHTSIFIFIIPAQDFCPEYLTILAT